VAKQQPFLDFKSKLAQDLGYQPNQIRLWVLVNRQNKTVRPDTVVPEHDPTLSKSYNVVPEESLLPQLTLRLFVAAMEVVRDKMASKAQDLKLYLEVLDPAHEAQPVESKEGQLMIFVKYFDVSDQTLAGVGHFYVHRNQRVAEVIPLINARMDFPENTPLKLYEVRVLLSISIMPMPIHATYVWHLIAASVT
jgi:ubiquitin carboxyl-terminal hydrolase 7